MIQSVINTPLVLPSNSSTIAFNTDNLRTRSANCCGFLQHNEGSPLYKIIEGGIYEISFTGTITSATAGIVALGVYEDGVLIPSTISAETIATAGDLTNLAIDYKIRVCCNSNTTISIGAVPSVLAGATLVATDTEIPTIVNGTLNIAKLK